MKSTPAKSWEELEGIIRFAKSDYAVEQVKEYISTTIAQAKAERDREIVEYLDEKIERAESNLRESHKIDPNCYGAGYDCGTRDALTDLKTNIEGKE